MTFRGFHKVIRPLTDPAAFGGDPKDALLTLSLGHFALMEEEPERLVEDALRGREEKDTEKCSIASSTRRSAFNP
jgi:hypothetical protein